MPGAAGGPGARGRHVGVPGPAEFSRLSHRRRRATVTAAPVLPTAAGPQPGRAETVTGPPATALLRTEAGAPARLETRFGPAGFRSGPGWASRTVTGRLDLEPDWRPGHSLSARAFTGPARQPDSEGRLGQHPARDGLTSGNRPGQGWARPNRADSPVSRGTTGEPGPALRKPPQALEPEGRATKAHGPICIQKSGRAGPGRANPTDTHHALRPAPGLGTDPPQSGCRAGPSRDYQCQTRHSLLSVTVPRHPAGRRCAGRGPGGTWGAPARVTVGGRVPRRPYPPATHCIRSWAS